MLVAPDSGAFPWPTAMIVWGAGDATSEHRHHSIQLILALAGNLRIRRGEDEPWHGCDAALVSAVFESRSPSAGRPIGPRRFARLVRTAGLPVYALGGVDARTARRLLDTGAVGLAAVEGFGPA